MDGDGANLKSSIDVEVSDFWALEAGVVNSIQISGASADLLLNAAYA